MEPADLARDTAVRALGDGRYEAELPPSWDFFAPSGGVLMTIALRAMQGEALGFRPMSATTTFVSAVPAGTLRVEVERLRVGNVATQLRARLRHVESNDVASKNVDSKNIDSKNIGLEVAATFVKDREGPRLLDRAPPADARSWDDAPPIFPEGARPRMSFFRQVEGRLAIGAPVFTSARFEPGPARYARWFRYRVPQRVMQHETERFDPLALPPLVDTMPAALIMALGSEHPPVFMPSLDLTVHFLAPTTHERLLCHSTCRFARDGWATCDMEIWDPDGELVAFGTQTMIVRSQPR